MVFCNYITDNKDTVTYAYGGHPSDITGEIVFAKDGSFFEIVKEPEREEVFVRSIKMLYSKYKNAFAKGTFEKKLSFES